MPSQTVVLDKPNSRSLKISLIYTAVLIFAWSLHVFLIRPWLGARLADQPFLLAVILTAIKAIIWLAPIPFLVKTYGRERLLSYLRLDRNIARGILWGLAAGAIYAAIFLGVDALWGDHRVVLHQSAHVWLSGILLVGLIEEIPFRGFILRKLEEQLPFVQANIITSLLFLTLHFPGWVSHGYSPGFYLINILGVLVRALFFGWLVKRTGSLWSAVAFHMINNFVAFTIFNI